MACQGAPAVFPGRAAQPGAEYPTQLRATAKSGPFAWNGLVGLYIAATFWAIWFFTMSHVLVKAIRRQAQEEREQFALDTSTQQTTIKPAQRAAFAIEGAN